MEIYKFCEKNQFVIMLSVFCFEKIIFHFY